jgi:hypothetical protein
MMKSWLEEQQAAEASRTIYDDLADIDPRFRPLMLRAIEQSDPVELERQISRCLRANPVCMDSATIRAMREACELAHWSRQQSAPSPGEMQTVTPPTDRADRWTKVAAYAGATIALIYLTTILLHYYR